jgi:hypothetical protein
MGKRFVLSILMMLLISFLACSCAQKAPEENVPDVIENEAPPPVIVENIPDETEPEPEDETDYSNIPITPQDFTGNNLHGGFVAVHDGLIYFSNQDDGNKLYRMDENGENITKLSDKSSIYDWLYIQIEGNQLFYIQTENIEETVMESGWTIRAMCSLYSYDLSNNTERKLVDNNIYTFVVSEGWIYFTTYDDNRLYRMRTDGSSKELIHEGMEPMAVQLCNDRLYVKHFESLRIMNLDGSDVLIFYYLMYAYHAYNDEIFNGRGQMTRQAIAEESLRFSEENGVTYGSLEPSITISEVEITEFDFNIFQQRIYYSTPDKKIYRMSINGSKPEYLADGYSPIVFSDYIFYLDNNDKLAWVANK